MKRLPEKTMMAAIILSCGFVIQADPSADEVREKNIAQARAKQTVEKAETSSEEVKRVKPAAKRSDIAQW